MPLPPLDTLRFFEAAARHESFLLAGEELNVSPPAISHRIKMLEANLKQELFKRSARGVSLTDVGRAYHQNIIDPLREIEARSDELRAPAVGRHLKVLCLASFAEKWLIQRMAKFSTDHPEVSFNLVIGYADTAEQEQAVDVWITSVEHPGKQHAVLFRDRLLLVASPGFLDQHGPEIDLAQLSKFKLLYDMHWKADWKIWSKAMGLPAPSLKDASGFQMHQLVVQGCVRGLGLAVVREKLVRDELASGQLVPVNPDASVDAGAYVVGQSRPISSDGDPANLFRNWVIAEFENADL